MGVSSLNYFAPSFLDVVASSYTVLHMICDLVRRLHAFKILALS